jgi:hypothetical protein
MIFLKERKNHRKYTEVRFTYQKDEPEDKGPSRNLQVSVAVPKVVSELRVRRICRT